MKVLMSVLLTAVLVMSGGTAARAAEPEMYPRGIGADLRPTPPTLGLSIRAGDDAAGLRTGTLDGRGYWQTQAAAGTTYLAVTPAADYVASVSGRPTVVMVTYYDQGTGRLILGTSTIADLREGYCGGGSPPRPVTGGGGTYLSFSFLQYSGYIVSGPPTTASSGMLYRSVSSFIAGCLPGR